GLVWVAGRKFRGIGRRGFGRRLAVLQRRIVKTIAECLEGAGQCFCCNALFIGNQLARIGLEILGMKNIKKGCIGLLFAALFDDNGAPDTGVWSDLNAKAEAVGAYIPAVKILDNAAL